MCPQLGSSATRSCSATSLKAGLCKASLFSARYIPFHLEAVRGVSLSKLKPPWYCIACENEFSRYRRHREVSWVGYRLGRGDERQRGSIGHGCHGYHTYVPNRSHLPLFTPRCASDLALILKTDKKPSSLQRLVSSLTKNWNRPASSREQIRVRSCMCRVRFGTGKLITTR